MRRSRPEAGFGAVIKLIDFDVDDMDNMIQSIVTLSPELLNGVYSGTRRSSSIRIAGGLDQGELITIPALPNLADWEKFEEARKALGPSLTRQHARCPLWQLTRKSFIRNAGEDRVRGESEEG